MSIHDGLPSPISTMASIMKANPNIVHTHKIGGYIPMDISGFNYQHHNLSINLFNNFSNPGGNTYNLHI